MPQEAGWTLQLGPVPIATAHHGWHLQGPSPQVRGFVLPMQMPLAARNRGPSGFCYEDISSVIIAGLETGRDNCHMQPRCVSQLVRPGSCAHPEGTSHTLVPERGACCC